MHRKDLIRLALVSNPAQHVLRLTSAHLSDTTACIHFIFNDAVKIPSLSLISSSKAIGTVSNKKLPMDLPAEGPIRPSNLTGALEACESFSDALCLFKTEHAVFNNSIDWLQASQDHIVNIIQNSPFFTQEERYECSDFVGKMRIYQVRSGLHLLACLLVMII